jgi:hypothetical protein|tara:strand:- start:1131 stop:2252 length:1122 start_codon:yes stop_codon:yes gene_type:complete
MNLENSISDLLSHEPFEIDLNLKKKKLIHIAKLQIEHHLKNCKNYKLWYKNNSFISLEKIKNYKDIPFLPSSIFKYLKLESVKTKVKQVNSSGTSSQLKSNIAIDKKTSINQRKALSKILSGIMGKTRKPFYVIDAQPGSQLSSDGSMSARNAGMQGYFIAAKSIKYLLKKNEIGNLIIDLDIFNNFLEESKKNPVVIIGYTFMLWEYFLNNSSINFNNLEIHKDSKILHHGGWKKLSNLNVKKDTFVKSLTRKTNLNPNYILDIYGFTEQLGTVYPSYGYDGCNVSSYSHIIVRDINTLKEVTDGQSGFLQFISPLPLSYPGFCLMNDDLGHISKRIIDKNENENIQFKVHSRLNKAVSRGCGDTLPENYYI